MRILGIDPGGRNTGVVVREGVVCLHHVVIRHAAYDTRVVVDAVTQIANDYQVHLVAVEGVKAPNPHLGLSNVDGILATAAVLGAVLAAWPNAVVVPPGGNGSLPLKAYPRQLVGERETAGTGILSHARSAYDVAGLAPRHMKTRKAIQ